MTKLEQLAREHREAYEWRNKCYASLNSARDDLGKGANGAITRYIEARHIYGEAQSALVTASSVCRAYIEGDEPL